MPYKHLPFGVDTGSPSLVMLDLLATYERGMLSTLHIQRSISEGDAMMLCLAKRNNKESGFFNTPY